MALIAGAPGIAPLTRVATARKSTSENFVLTVLPNFFTKTFFRKLKPTCIRLDRQYNPAFAAPLTHPDVVSLSVQKVLGTLSQSVLRGPGRRSLLSRSLDVPTLQQL